MNPSLVYCSLFFVQLNLINVHIHNCFLSFIKLFDKLYQTLLMTVTSLITSMNGAQLFDINSLPSWIFMFSDEKSVTKIKFNLNYKELQGNKNCISETNNLLCFVNAFIVPSVCQRESTEVPKTLIRCPGASLK